MKNREQLLEEKSKLLEIKNIVELVKKSMELGSEITPAGEKYLLHCINELLLIGGLTTGQLEFVNDLKNRLAEGSTNATPHS